MPNLPTSTYETKSNIRFYYFLKLNGKIFPPQILDAVGMGPLC